MNSDPTALIEIRSAGENDDALAPVETFVIGLQNEDRSLARRVYAAWFIKAHRQEIEAYLQQRVKESGAHYSTQRWVRDTRKRIHEYANGPKGYAYNPKTGSLVSLYVPSFRLVRYETSSLTFHTLEERIRAIGYLLAVGFVAFLIWVGYQVSGAIDRSGEEWGRLFEELMRQ